MKRKFWLGQLIVFCLMSTMSFAQLPQYRGLYVDGFVTKILGNATQETALLDYIQANQYNSITLYELSRINYSNSTQVGKLASFISKARERGVTSVGSASEINSFFEQFIIPYNNAHASNERFNVLNFEFEFWVPESTKSGGVYCTNYLQPNGYACSEAGAFDFYVDELKAINQLAKNNGMKTEIYVGWFNQAQANAFVPYTDRILLHAYVKDQNTAFNYSKSRLEFIENTGKQVEVIGLFSAEPAFLQGWLSQNNNDILNAYNIYHNQLVQNRSWTNVKENGYQWFAYSFVPKNGPTMGEPEQPAPDPQPEVQLTLAPNPAVNLVKVIGDTSWVKTIAVVDVRGRTVMNFAFKAEFSVKSLRRGTYFVKLTGTNKNQTIKLLKR